MKFLILNSGSSSQKACLYEIGGALPTHPPAPLWEGRIEWNGARAATAVKNSSGVKRSSEFSFSSREQVVRDLLETLWAGDARAIASASEIDAVGHRVVHGGPKLEDPVIITSQVRETIAGVAAFAPLHIEAELEGVAIARKLLGGVPQVAVFDTGFHQQMPLAAAVYPVPYEWFQSGIRRYGFHGINHQYCARRAGEMLGHSEKARRVVSCHLGNGCSVAAIDGGRSVDTTMGFTPLDGLMMGTRSGAVDPSILTYLMRQGEWDAEKMDSALNHQSGLLGVSGLSSDMRTILAAAKKGHERSKLAFDIYVHRLRSAIGAMAAAMGGIDVLVFTAGIGENSPEVRAAASRDMQFLGVSLDEQANAQPVPDADIAAADSRVRVLVIRAEEDWAIATECWKLIHGDVSSVDQPSAIVRHALAEPV